MRKDKSEKEKSEIKRKEVKQGPKIVNPVANIANTSNDSIPQLTRIENNTKKIIDLLDQGKKDGEFQFNFGIALGGIGIAAGLGVAGSTSPNLIIASFVILMLSVTLMIFSMINYKENYNKTLAISSLITECLGGLTVLIASQFKPSYIKYIVWAGLVIMIVSLYGLGFAGLRNKNKTNPK